MPPRAARALSWLATVGAALVIGGMPFWFAGTGLHAYFTTDDTMNIYGYWTKPWRDLLAANLAYYSPFYRPMGGLFYRSVFAVFGFNPLPFRAACFALILVNLALLYAAARTLAGSREVGLLTALAGSYHAGFEDLYYNTGMVYDLLCFLFYVGALLVYSHARREGRPLGWSNAIGVVTLYICALNSKEMAVTLPVVTLIYEWIYHRPKLGRSELLHWISRELWLVWLLAAMTAPFLLGKLSPASAFAGIPDYQIHISPARYLGTYQHYLDCAVYKRAAWFTPAGTLLLWGAMLIVAARSRRKVLWFSFWFILVSVLPVIFITPRGTIAVLYLPYLGWALYAAALLVSVREALAEGLARLAPRLRATGAKMRRLAPAMTFAAAVVFLFPAHQANTFSPQTQPMIRSTAEQIHRLLPKLPANSRILFLEDPFPADDWTLPAVVRLSYGDRTIAVDRVKRMTGRPDPKEIGSYSVVLTYQGDRLVRVDPARAGGSPAP